MKNTILFVALLFGFLFTGFLSTAHAQGTASLTAEDSWKDIKIGPFFSGGEAVSAGTVANGAKTSTAFAFSAGADADFPLNQNIAFNLGVAYDARGIGFYQQDNSSNKVSYNFSYLELRPEFRFSGFLLGVGVGLPVSASSSVGGNILPQTATPVGPSGMNVLFEIRLGGAIPILQSSSGVLNLTLEGAYAFTQITTNTALTPYNPLITPPTSSNNGPLASAEIGFQYLFDLTPH
jgi:hypothetical protein